jgi:putative phage-type endonuclease
VIKVSSKDQRWLRPGVGSTEIASLLGCGAIEEQSALVAWAKVVQKIELTEIKQVQKQVLQQGSKEWHNWRKLGVGGSEVACVVGANPYRDSQADRVWARKLPEDHPYAKPETADNDAMARGRKFEPDARKLYESLFGWTVKDVCVLHDDYPHVRCSLDGLSTDDKLVAEIKCPGDKNHEKYITISRIQDNFERQTAFAKTFPYYRYQVLYQLLITGAEVCHFVSYSPEWRTQNDRFVLITLYPEPDEQVRLLERVNLFWQFVESRTPPPKEWLEPCWNLPTSLLVQDKCSPPSEPPSSS